MTEKPTASNISNAQQLAAAWASPQSAPELSSQTQAEPLSLLKAVNFHIIWFAPKPQGAESQGATHTFHPFEKMDGETETEWQCFQACAAAPCRTGQFQPPPKGRTHNLTPGHPHGAEALQVQNYKW